MSNKPPAPFPHSHTSNRAAIYVRVSTTDKGQEVENQLIDLRKVVAGRGWELVKVYRDQESGAKSRPQFKSMFADARRGLFDIVLFWSLDRFSREGVYETLEHLRTLDGYGVRFLSLQEQYLDTLGPFREAVIGILAAVAGMERQRISERVKAGMRRAAGQGVKFGRPRAKIPDDTLLLMVEEGWSLRRIAEQLGVGKATVYRRKQELGI